MAARPFASADTCKVKVILCQETAQVDQGYMYCFRIVIVRSCYKSFWVYTKVDLRIIHLKQVAPVVKWQIVAWKISMNGYKIDFPMPILHPFQYGGINLHLTSQCSRDTWQYTYKPTKHIWVKGMGIYFFRTLILCLTTFAATMKAKLLKSSWKPSAVTLHWACTLQVSLGFYWHQQKEEINCFLGDCILLIWCPWLMMLRFRFHPIHAPQMCAHSQFT